MKAVDFEIVSEPWAAEYKLADGNKIILRVVLVKVFDPGTVAQDGAPSYMFQSQVLIRIERAGEEKVQFKTAEELKN